MSIEGSVSGNYLISSDLDGTLIDHHSYSYEAALPAIKRCQDLGVPIILNTSKTFSEASAIQAALKISAPLIVENGSAVFLPKLDTDELAPKLFGVSRHRVLSFIDSIRREHGWRLSGFNDWSVAEISAHTGLNEAEAQRADSKQFSEPFVWRDTDEAFTHFAKLAGNQDLKILKGGRFYHLQGDTDKAKPLRWLQQQYVTASTTKNGVAPTLIALGDNHNDVAMLNAADIAVCVRSPVADYPLASHSKRLIQTKGYGPQGWNEAINSIFDG